MGRLSVSDDDAVSHWRSGWKFWPDRPKGPVDDAYRQIRWVLPYRPGFPRVAFTLGVGLLASYPLAVAVVVAYGPGVQLTSRVLFLLIVVLPFIGLMLALGRGFTTGVYVNDAGMRVVTVRRTLVASWAEVVDVSTVDARTRWAGLPFVKVPGEVVVVTLRDVGPFSTPITSIGPDFLGRAEAFDMAAGAVERWWRDAGGEARRNHQSAA